MSFLCLKSGRESLQLVYPRWCQGKSSCTMKTILLAPISLTLYVSICYWELWTQCQPTAFLDTGGLGGPAYKWGKWGSEKLSLRPGQATPPSSGRACVPRPLSGLNHRQPLSIDEPFCKIITIWMDPEVSSHKRIGQVESSWNATAKFPVSIFPLHTLALSPWTKAAVPWKSSSKPQKTLSKDSDSQKPREG